MNRKWKEGKMMEQEGKIKIGLNIDDIIPTHFLLIVFGVNDILMY